MSKAAISGVASAILVVAMTGVYLSRQPRAFPNSTSVEDNSTFVSDKFDNIGIYHVDTENSFDYEENSFHSERREKVREVEHSVLCI